MNYLQDKNISYAATGLLSLINTFPNNWEIVISDLAKRKNSSEYEVRKLIKELIQYGYIRKITQRDEYGRIIKIYYKKIT